MRTPCSTARERMREERTPSTGRIIHEPWSSIPGPCWPARSSWLARPPVPRPPPRARRRPPRRPLRRSTTSLDAPRRPARRAAWTRRGRSTARRFAFDPRWAEGLWYLGTLAYDGDRFAECRDTFRRLLAVQPKATSAWALRGLCEFHLKEYEAARRHLESALASGPLETEAMARVVAFHRALLAIRGSAFDLAIAPLTELLRTQAETPELVEACGLVLLRRAVLPADVPSSERELVVTAGRAYCAHLARDTAKARERFAVLLERYPRERHVHYGWGLSLAQQGSPEAMAEFRREIELHPDHELAHVELAFNLLTRGQAEEALASARAGGQARSRAVRGSARPGPGPGRDRRRGARCRRARGGGHPRPGHPGGAPGPRPGLCAGGPEGGRRPRQRHVPEARLSPPGGAGGAEAVSSPPRRVWSEGTRRLPWKWASRSLRSCGVGSGSAC